MSRRIVLLAAACMLTACGGSSKPAAVTLNGQSWTPPPVLANVPADTPYLLAQLAPMSQEFRDRMFAQADAKIAEATKALEALPKDFDRSAMPAWIRVVFAWMDELKGKDMKHWSREMGLDTNQAFVLYGLGVWPVARIGVNDTARLHGTIERILGKANVQTAERELRGKKYWVFQIERFSVAVAVLDKEMVATIVPASALDAALPNVLALEKPKHSLGETDTLGASLAHYKFLPQAVAVIDVRALAARFASASASSPLEAPLAALTGPVTQACRDDVTRFVDVVPRVFGGYHALDAKHLDFSMVAEMPPAIVARLRKLTTAVPGVNQGLNGHPLFALGLAMNTDATIALAKEVVHSLRERPLRCDWFTGVNMNVEELASQLDSATTAQLKGIDGGTLMIDELDVERRYGEATVTLVGRSAAERMETLLHLVPGFASTNLSTVGPAVEIPIGLLGGPPEMTAHILARPQRAAIAIGPGSEKVVSAVIAAPTPQRSPLVSVQMNMPRLQAVTKQATPSYGMELEDLVMQLVVVDGGLSFDVLGTIPPPKAPAPALAH